MSEPKILLVDIETAPTLAYVWGLFDQNVGIDQIKQDSYVLCWCAKWFGKRGTMFDSIQNYPLFKKEPANDINIAKSAHKLLSEADIIVAHNGDGFDIKWLNYIFIKHNLPPIQPTKSVDTLKVARANFLFTSNKLDFISQRLGVGAKVKHEGFGLWTKCMAGCKKAWQRMERYNRRDVLILERVYERVRPFMKSHPLLRPIKERANGKECPLCHKPRLQKRGFNTTSIGRFIRYQCMACGKWSNEKKPFERFS